MTDGPRLALAGFHQPAVRLLNLDTGEHIGLDTPLNNGGAFDQGLGRRGWVAAQVEYQVGGSVDGSDLSAPNLLPEAWSMLPAASDDLILLQRYFGRSALPGERTHVVVVDADGRELRSAVLPWGVNAHVVGETHAGVVTWNGIVGWDGQVHALPADVVGDPFTDARPVGVLAGCRIVFEGVNYVESVDTRTGTSEQLPLPAKPRLGPFGRRFRPGLSHDATGNWMVAAGVFDDSFEREDLLVAGADGQLRWLPARPRSVTMWVGQVLVSWDFKTGRPTAYDPATDTTSASDLAPLNFNRAVVLPRIDVTGRFAWLAD